jgi:small neutral amino acid transporter SnatA (MarC family)
MGLMLTIFCIVALVSPLASLTAFLIFYDEYEHHYADKRKTLKIALEAAVFTLLFFLFLGLLLAIILPLCF